VTGHFLIYLLIAYAACFTLEYRTNIKDAEPNVVLFCLICISSLYRYFQSMSPYLAPYLTTPLQLTAGVVGACCIIISHLLAATLPFTDKLLRMLPVLLLYACTARGSTYVIRNTQGCLLFGSA
jgi:hypothetical protein